jgi:hypothetical protein
MAQEIEEIRKDLARVREELARIEYSVAHVELKLKGRPEGERLNEIKEELRKIPKYGVYSRNLKTFKACWNPTLQSYKQGQEDYR